MHNIPRLVTLDASGIVSHCGFAGQSIKNYGLDWLELPKKICIHFRKFLFFVFSYRNILMDALNQFKSTHVFAAQSCKPEQSFRKSLFSNYKKDSIIRRKEFPEIMTQLENLATVHKYLQIPNAQHYNLDSGDLIASQIQQFINYYTVRNQQYEVCCTRNFI